MPTYQIEQPTLPLSEALDHLKNAVQTALDWEPENADLLCKLAAVRSLATTFCSCLEQALESDQGKELLDQAAELNPSLTRSVLALQGEREMLLHEIDGIARQLRDLNAEQQDNFMHLCNQLRLYLTRFAAHKHRETETIQEAFNQDNGGEG